ncbi:MAG TPA: hypothetical protein QF564_26140 [Pirellulaceae bacterium]|nr:hypothetical protein [Pirellulaceae bacterium]
MTSLLQRCAPLLMLLAVPTMGHGQADGDTDPQTTVNVTPGGVRRFEPGAWSTLSMNGSNRTKADTNEFVSVFIGTNLSPQFARRFWLPARTRRLTFIPILIPKASTTNPSQAFSDSPQISASIMRLSETDGTETFESNPSESRITGQPLVLDYSQTKSGLLLQRAMPDETGLAPEMDWDIYEMAYKARESAVDSRVMIDFGQDFMPPFPTTLNSLDQMVISGDRILNDSAGLANLRHWLQQGGRIWIMLDQTSMETVTALLGNAASCTVVDRVELNEFQLEDQGDIQDLSGKPVVQSWSSEIPVEMLRVFAGTDDIHCRVDGWPVAFWQKVGDGEVLFTTLEARGWISGGDASPALRTLASRFFQPYEEMPVDSTAIGAMLNDQIGYRIPSRRLATWILGLNSLAILSFGCWWARQHRLDRLAWFVPGTALVTSAVFLVVGSRNTVAVPSTVATGQIVRVSNATNETHISAVTAIYSQESGELELTAESGALATVNTLEAQGAIKRIVWDDDGQSRWANLQQPSGVVRYIDSKRTVSHGAPRVAHGTFDETGFHGTLTGIDAGQCEDAVIVAAPARASAVSLNSDGSFSIGTPEVLADGQYIADGLMSDKQRSRQQLLRQLLASTATNPFGTEPSLLVWMPPLDMGVKFDASFEKVGSALTSIPLRIERPATGIDVQIPATFIRIQSFAGRYGSSSVFNHRTGQWMEHALKPTQTYLSFVVPKALVPLQLTQATLTIKINAPSRTLKIEGIVDGTPTLLHERSNPNGVLRIVIDRPEALELDATGGFQLVIQVTETELQRQIREGRATSKVGQFDNSTWQIDYVSLDAMGTMR